MQKSVINSGTVKRRPENKSRLQERLRMQTVELIDENDNVMEYKGVRDYKLRGNLIYIDELIMSDDGIKEIKIDSESVWKRRNNL